MSIDLKKLENKLDEALSNETNETLTKFLTNKRMSNNKQSSVELFIEQLEEKGDAWENASIRRVNISIDVSEYMELKTKAKAMHKEESESKYQEGREIGKIEVLTSQSTKNASEYSQGYNKGFLAALEYMNSTIENKIKLRQYEK